MAPTTAERMRASWRASKFRFLTSLVMLIVSCAYLLFLLSSRLRGAIALPATIVSFLFHPIALLGFGVIGLAPNHYHGLWGVVRGAALALVIVDGVVAVLMFTGTLSTVPAALTSITSGAWLALVVWNGALRIRAGQ